MATESLREMFVAWSEGNMGAMSFLNNTVSDENIRYGIPVLARLDKTNIRGWKLHVFWKDLCGFNMENAYKLASYCPKETLEDACGRQDYTGKSLIEYYLTS